MTVQPTQDLLPFSMYCSASIVSVLSVTPQGLEVNQTSYAATPIVKDAGFTGEAKSPRRGQM